MVETREKQGAQRRSHDKVYHGARADQGGAVMFEPFSNGKVFFIYYFIYFWYFYL